MAEFGMSVLALLVHMYDLRGGKAVEPGGRGVAVSPDVFGVDQIVDFELRQFLRLRDGVHAVARLSEDRADFGFTPLERLQIGKPRCLRSRPDRRFRASAIPAIA